MTNAPDNKIYSVFNTYSVLASKLHSSRIPLATGLLGRLHRQIRFGEASENLLSSFLVCGNCDDLNIARVGHH